MSLLYRFFYRRWKVPWHRVKFLGMTAWSGCHAGSATKQFSIYLVLPCTRLDTDDHWQLAEKDQVTSILQCGLHQDLIPNGSLELKRFAVSGTVETGFYLYQVQQQLLDDICIMFVMLSCFVSVLKFDWGVSHSVEICKISCVPEAPQCRLCPMHNAGWTERRLTIMQACRVANHID